MRRPVFLFTFLFTCFHLSAQMARRANPDAAYIESRCDTVEMFLSVKPDSAYLLAEQTLAEAKQIRYRKGEARVLFVIGKVFKQKGNYPLALHYYRQSQAIYEELHDVKGVAGNILFTGEVHFYQENYRQALVYYFQAKALYHSLKMDYATALTMLKISDCYEKTNRLDSALFCIKQIALLENNQDDIYKFLNGKILFASGNIYAKKDSLEQAMKNYRQSLPFLNDEQEDRTACQVMLNMAELFQKQRRDDSCLYYASQSLKQAKEAGFMLEVLNAAGFLARYFKAHRQSDSALVYLETSIAAKDSLFSREKTTAIQNLLSEDERHRQELLAEQQRIQSQTKIFSLLAALVVFLVIAFLLWRNNKQKQKANLLLQQQKQEVQNTLTELKALQQQLIHAEKMASLGEVTAGIAHEIQNPLNFITNFSELSSELLTEVKEDIQKGQPVPALDTVDSLAINLQKITEHGKRADAIVKNMLQHSRKNTGVKEETDMNQLVEEYLCLSYEAMRAKEKSFHAILETHFGAGIKRIELIPQDMGRVFLNLFNNAFYSVNEKSKMVNGGYEPLIQVVTQTKVNAVEIRIKDNGMGIAEKVVDKIYQPFFTTKPTGQGTGLGLSMSYDIVTKVHGGKMNVNTRQGEYAEFIIELPIHQS